MVLGCCCYSLCRLCAPIPPAAPMRPPIIHHHQHHHPHLQRPSLLTLFGVHCIMAVVLVAVVIMFATFVIINLFFLVITIIIITIIIITIIIIDYSSVYSYSLIILIESKNNDYYFAPSAATSFLRARACMMKQAKGLTKLTSWPWSWAPECMEPKEPSYPSSG